MRYVLITSLLLSCSSQESEIEAIPESALNLKRFMELNPTSTELQTKIESMNLPIGFVWHQGSPYTFTSWKMDSGWTVTIYGWGDVATHAELYDSEGEMTVKLIYKSEQEAWEELSDRMEKGFGRK